MSASKVKAGQVFVEIGADPRAFFSALNKINRQIGNLGRSMSGAGTKIAGMGAAALLPFGAAIRQGTAYQSTLLNIQASTGATAAELDRIRAAGMQVSQALGVGPTEATQGFLELLKAGMSLEQVLGGAGQTALEFAKVGNMDVAAASVVMADAMKVFGVTADVAANTMSSAADASSTSIEEMTMAFSQSAAVAALANQSMGDLSAALAVLANNGVKGSDAGTSVKTMLMRLMAPADDAAVALEQVGLSAMSFRGADGQIKPMVEIIGTLNSALAGMDQAAKDDIFRRIFGQDAIRAAAILTATGVDGFNAMTDAMGNALPVSEKYKTLSAGLAGAMASVAAAMQRAAIAISEAVGPALMAIAGPIGEVIDGFTKFVVANQELVAGFARFAVGAVGVGVALTGVGLSLQASSFAMGALGKSVALAMSPLSVLLGATSSLGRVFAVASAQAVGLATSVGAAMLSASSSVLSFAASAATSLAAMAAASSAGMATLAASTTAGFARMAGSAAAASQAMFPVFFTGFNRGISAGAGFFAATTRGLNGVVMASGVLRTALLAVSGSGVARFVTDIGSGLALTYKSFVWWATGATARMAQYIASMTGAVGATIASTAAMATAWMGTAARGVLAFVGASTAGLASYLGAAAMAVAGSVASAAAVAAAWLAPLAPFALLAAALGGAVALAYSFGGSIKSAFSGLGELVGQAGAAIGGTFGGAIAEATTVFGDLATTATTTFNGIYSAIAEGDLSGAMDVLWAGLYAGWLRGVESIMNAVDPWVSMFQNAFTILGAEIYKIWDSLWTNVGATVNTAGAYLLGAFDNIINPILAAWDTLEAGIRKSWNRIQSFLKKGFDLKKENDKVDSEMAARRRQREIDRPGIEGRTDRAAQENARAEKERADRERAIDDNTQATIDGREGENERRRGERRAATEAAEGAVAGKGRGKRETQARNQQFTDLLKQIEGANSSDKLTDLYDEFQALASSGRLTSQQSMAIEAAWWKAQNKMSSAAGKVGGAGSSPGEQAAAGAGAAGADAAQSKAEVAGTFSSTNLGGMGFGSSLGERQLKALETIASNTSNMEGPAYAQE